MATKWETLRNLGVTMLLAGLWHGASWIFVLWGAYHGALLIAYHFPPLNLLAGKEERFSWRTLIAMPLMWLLILVGWAIFRSADLPQLWSWFSALGHWQTSLALPWRSSCAWLLIHTVPLILLQLLTLKYRHESGLRHLSWPVKGLVYVLLVLLVVSSSEQDREFIYFQF